MRLLSRARTTMKLTAQESIQRKIGDRGSNCYIADGVPPHQATLIAPPSLLSPIPEELVPALRVRHAELEENLTQTIGKPLYSNAGFILYNGDACELMRALGKERISFDLTVTSPPYNIGKEYERPMSVEDYIAWCSKWMSSIYDITTPTGAFWLNVGYLEVPGKGLCVPIPYLLWDRSRFFLLQEIVWKYGAGVSTKNRLTPRNEKWLFYVKDARDYTFRLAYIRDPNVKYPNQKKNGKFRCNPLGKNPSDVWEFPKVTTGTQRSSRERSGHPAQFPLAVVERIILASSKPGDLVLDPFAGSCSAGLAAIGLGRIFVGIELRQDYCDLAIKRFEDFLKARRDAQRQMSLL